MTPYNGTKQLRSATAPISFQLDDLRYTPFRGDYENMHALRPYTQHTATHGALQPTLRLNRLKRCSVSEQRAEAYRPCDGADWKAEVLLSWARPPQSKTIKVTMIITSYHDSSSPFADE